MSQAEIEAHLRAAVELVAAAQHARMTAVYETGDRDFELQVALLAPVLGALEALRRAVGRSDLVDIAIAQQGHTATVTLYQPTGALDGHLVVGADSLTRRYEVRASRHLLEGAVRGRRHFDHAADVVRVVTEIVGRHLGAARALAERTATR